MLLARIELVLDYSAALLHNIVYFFSLFFGNHLVELSLQDLRASPYLINIRQREEIRGTHKA